MSSFDAAIGSFLLYTWFSQTKVSCIQSGASVLGYLVTLVITTLLGVLSLLSWADDSSD
jgi:hypothetical protein